jgi:hypothetical protein
MARHSEEECAYCEGDVLPLSYIVGEDDQLYCSVKCADLGERRAQAEKNSQRVVRTIESASSPHTGW